MNKGQEEFGLSTLHTRGQSIKAIALQNAYIVVLFYQSDGLSKEVYHNTSPFWFIHLC